jgi:hypothetical protein
VVGGVGRHGGGWEKMGVKDEVEVLLTVEDLIRKCYHMATHRNSPSHSLLGFTRKLCRTRGKSGISKDPSYH